jgi:ABC-2 type transport system permease protein
MTLLEISPQRIAGLARANATLVTRNRLTFIYAVVLPLLPLGLLLVGDNSSRSAGANAVLTALMMAALFPVYANLLSQFVTRRDELVLKRLRTGESTDADIIVSLALPGLAVALTTSALAVLIRPSMCASRKSPRTPCIIVLVEDAIRPASPRPRMYSSTWAR